MTVTHLSEHHMSSEKLIRVSKKLMRLIRTRKINIKRGFAINPPFPIPGSVTGFTLALILV